MSVTGAGGIGIPVILLHDAEGGHVTIELKNRFVYRGILDEAQDNFNCTLKNCVRIDPLGEETQLEMTLIRGGQIRFIVVPEMLKHAPYFDRIKAWRKYKGNPIVGGTGEQFKGRTAKVHERAQQKSQQQQYGEKRGRGGGPVPGQGYGRGPGPAYGRPPPHGGYGGPPPGQQGYGGAPRGGMAMPYGNSNMPIGMPHMQQYPPAGVQQGPPGPPGPPMMGGPRPPGPPGYQHQIPRGPPPPAP